MFATNRFFRIARIITVLCGIGSALPVQASENNITLDAVYVQTMQIEKEIDLLKRYYKITATNPVAAIEAELLPHHIWQKTYAILTKLNIFRLKHGLTGFSPVVQEAELKLDPRANWGQMLRILTEIKIAKNYLSIATEVSPPTPTQSKRTIDIFNKLNRISYDMDALNGEPISPAYVYAEAMRLNEDVNAILYKAGVTDTAVPPVRNEVATPKNSLDAAFTLLTQIQRIQRQLGLVTTDLSVFRKNDQDTVIPADVFNLVTLCLGELQLVKARLELSHKITPAAEFQEDKTPADVTQLLGYVTNKLSLVELN